MGGACLSLRGAKRRSNPPGESTASAARGIYQAGGQKRTVGASQWQGGEGTLPLSRKGDQGGFAHEAGMRTGATHRVAATDGRTSSYVARTGRVAGEPPRRRRRTLPGSPLQGTGSAPPSPGRTHRSSTTASVAYGVLRSAQARGLYKASPC